MIGERPAEEVDGRTFFVYDGETADEEFLVGSLTIPSEEEGDPEVFEVIWVCSLDERALVALPQPAWHRRAALRRLPPGALVRATAVEVAAAGRGSRAVRAEGVRIKIWLGFLEETLVQATLFDGSVEPTVLFAPVDGAVGYLPLGEALVEIAKDKFQFHTAESGDPAPRRPPASAGDERLARLEAAMQAMTETVKALSVSRPPADKAAATEQAGAPGGWSQAQASHAKAPPKPRASAQNLAFPGLDPGVVRSALASGVEPKALEEMAGLLSSNPARRLKDTKVVATDPLEESDGEAPQPAAQPGGGVGLAEVPAGPPLDPVAAALVKLTTLVEDMHLSKSARGSRLEQALDGAASGASAGDAGGVSSRKNSVARRALRQALHDSPEEIYQAIERLMLEDLMSTTLSPGMPRPVLSARAWLENRSRLTNYQASVRTAWGVGGILDCLIQGREKEARARACLMIVQADQVALDKGAWTLASEISLEQHPPFHSFAAHAHGDISDQPVSRLLEPRWAEIFLHHLQDTETYLEKRRKLQKPKGQASEDASEATPKPKAKPKAKGNDENRA